MKRYQQFATILLTAVLIGSHTVPAGAASRYRDYVVQATLALENEEFPSALFYIKAAHFADKSQREPFYLLEQLPAFSNYKRTFRHYFEMAVAYYLRQDFRNARFFFAAAHHADPAVPSGVKMIRHVDGVLSGAESPQTDQQGLREIAGTVRIESEPVRVGPHRVEPVRRGKYTVEHSAEFEAIMAKYFDDVAARQRERQRKIDAARQDVSRRQNQMSKIIQAQKLKQRAVRTLTATGQQPATYRNPLIPAEDSRDLARPDPKPAASPAQAEREPATEAKERGVQGGKPAQPSTRITDRKTVIEAADTIRLDEDLWQGQPGTVLEIEFGTAVILQGERIERFLVLDPEITTAERQSEDEVLLTMLRRGSTLFHVWDDRGRWTFQLKGVLPLPVASLRQQESDRLEQYAPPWRVSYANNWNSFYLGDSPDNLDRRTLSFTQWVGVYGDTPYGFVDASANFFRFDTSTENTGRTLGLSNAHLGPFENFSVRGWDASKRFSELSLPGRFFRGILFDTEMLDGHVEVSYLKGQDRAVFLQTSQGVTETRKSYIEGARVAVRPDEDSELAFNFAHGYGEERPAFLNEKVFSVEAKSRIRGVDAHWETAYDEDNFGNLLLTEYKEGDATLRVNFRDLHKGFTTITSRPAGSGEIGANVVFDYRPDEYQFSTNLDIFRDREQENPDDPDNVNIDFGTVYSRPLGQGYHWNSSFFLSKTPQLISPRTSLRLNATLSKSFQVFFERRVSTFVTASAQLSRFDKSPSSEYDRYGIGVGLRLPLIDRLNFFVNYDQSFVEVKNPRERSQPNVMNTGLSYSRNFGQRVSGRASVTYRNEEDTDGRFSFLSGSDTIRGSVGMSYRPRPQVEIFFDGSLRNVLSESDNQPAFHDADIRLGVRTDWDTVFRWNPSATVKGTVYKDLNRNGRHDPDEPGVEGILVRLGRQTVTTDSRGTYRGTVRAKKVKVGLDFDSVPQGYSLGDYLMNDIDIQQGKTYTVDYGFVTRSGIYGVFFEDINGNKKYERDEPTVARARMLLDGKEVAAADFEGVYQFYDVGPGEHTLTIDVNALPREYLPTIRLRNTIEVQEGRTYTFHVPLKKRN